jgi:hypothetical protein
MTQAQPTQTSEAAPLLHARLPHSARYQARCDARVRWSALAVGSTVGIASWATLYVWGAALMCLTQSQAAPAFGAANLALALYGGLAAGAALWAGSATASRTAGATTRQAGAFHGLAMWGMANITLVLVVGLLGIFGTAFLHGPLAYIVHIGALAVSGGAAVSHGEVEEWSMASALLSMGLVMLSSLVLGVWGGIWGIVRPQPAA